MHGINNIARQLWHDTHGQISLAMLILLVSIVCLGSIVGLATVRDYVVQEFGDAAVAIDRLDQSYSVEIVINGNPPIYQAQYSDPGPSLTDPPGTPPACLQFTAPEPEDT